VVDDRTHTRPCVYREELNLHTLVWTRGRNFPLARLESRLMCPRCGNRSRRDRVSAAGRTATCEGGEAGLALLIVLELEAFSERVGVSHQ
jgi:hypothetical protein